MGGAAMAAAGAELWVDSSELGVIGVGELIGKFGRIRRALRVMKCRVAAERPDLLVCVDYKEFNFRLAKAAKRAGVKVLFYVGPQVWAWRPGRVQAYGRVVDHMAVIFPFEVPLYERYGIPVTYVGHPLAGKVRSDLSVAQAREAFEVGHAERVVGLLPGSRGNEIQRLLPVMLQAAQHVADQLPRTAFLLAQSDAVAAGEIQHYVKQHGLTVHCIKGRFYDLLRACDAVMICSGTATLEAALMGVPMAIAYRLSPLSYWLAKWLVKVPYIGLPNIIAGQRVVNEYIQEECKADILAAEILRLLQNRYYAEQQISACHHIATKIGVMDGISALLALILQKVTNK